MKNRKKYNKPVTKVVHIHQEFPLMSGSGNVESKEPELHNEVLEDGEQLSKPSGPFPFFMESLDSREEWREARITKIPYPAANNNHNVKSRISQ